MLITKCISCNNTSPDNDKHLCQNCISLSNQLPELLYTIRLNNEIISRTHRADHAMNAYSFLEETLQPEETLTLEGVTVLIEKTGEKELA